MLTVYTEFIKNTQEGLSSHKSTASSVQPMKRQLPILEVALANSQRILTTTTKSHSRTKHDANLIDGWQSRCGRRSPADAR